MAVRTFSKDTFTEREISTVDDLAEIRDASPSVWIEITGLTDLNTIEAVGRIFDLHQLTLEDVVSRSQGPKVEHYDGYLFVVMKALFLTDEHHVRTEHTTMFLSKETLITFHENAPDYLDPVRDRLRRGLGRIRTGGVDFLAHAITDAIVDHYFPVMEGLDDYLDDVEDELVTATTTDAVALARSVRFELQTIRHVVWPMRGVLTSFLRDDSDLITADTRVYFRDCYDHLVHIQGMIEMSREMAATLLEAYVSTVSLRTNQVIKVLTVIATIFIPLTFITGVYGMNFDPQSSPYNMPELRWYWGYPFAITTMLGTAAVLLTYFRVRGWLGAGGRRQYRGGRHGKS